MPVPTPFNTIGKAVAAVAIPKGLKDGYTLIERIIDSCSPFSVTRADRAFATGAMTPPKPHNPTPDAIREARLAARLTQTEAAHTVYASLRGWQQWEAGDRAMPLGLFELFMLKTGQWPLR